MVVTTHYSVDAYTRTADDFWKRESRQAERRAKNAERALREEREGASASQSSTPDQATPPAPAGQTKGEPNGSV